MEQQLGIAYARPNARVHVDLEPTILPVEPLGNPVRLDAPHSELIVSGCNALAPRLCISEHHPKRSTGRTRDSGLKIRRGGTLSTWGGAAGEPAAAKGTTSGAGAWAIWPVVGQYWGDLRIQPAMEAHP